MSEDNNTNNKKNIILIDTDILVYRSSSAVQKDIDWGDGLWTCHAYLSDAQETLYNTLSDIKAELYNLGYKDNYYCFCVSDKHNFRKDINPDYKANRVNHRKPTCYYALLETLKEAVLMHPDDGMWSCYENLEGDDAIALGGTFTNDDDKLIVSMDKDFKTVPCDYYNFNTKELYCNDGKWVNAFNNTIYQVLKGDITDGYKGAVGYGDKKAQALIKKYEFSPEDLWKAVVEEAFKGNEEEALVQWKMAHLLWSGEYNYVTHEVLHMHPLDLISKYSAI